MLKQIGYDLAVDCIFGKHTEEAVFHYQDTHRLHIDGIVGKETWGSLIK
jgi:peptidoglycan hydrolase-like protein with peptidoglycan-binding domain